MRLFSLRLLALFSKRSALSSDVLNYIHTARVLFCDVQGFKLLNLSKRHCWSVFQSITVMQCRVLPSCRPTDRNFGLRGRGQVKFIAERLSFDQINFAISWKELYFRKEMWHTSLSISLLVCVFCAEDGRYKEQSSHRWGEWFTLRIEDTSEQFWHGNIDAIVLLRLHDGRSGWQLRQQRSRTVQLEIGGGHALSV